MGRLKVIYNSDPVDEIFLRDDEIYIYGYRDDDKNHFAAQVPCPCGAEHVTLFLADKAKTENGIPYWQMSDNADGTVTFYPSFHLKRTCGCHYSIRKSEFVKH